MVQHVAPDLTIQAVFVQQVTCSTCACAAHDLDMQTDSAGCCTTHGLTLNSTVKH